jgi:hypothetical protein
MTSALKTEIQRVPASPIIAQCSAFNQQKLVETAIPSFLIRQKVRINTNSPSKQ